MSALDEHSLSSSAANSAVSDIARALKEEGSGGKLLLKRQITRPVQRGELAG